MMVLNTNAIFVHTEEIGRKFEPIHKAEDIKIYEQQLIGYEKEIVNPIILNYTEPK
jgi:hypothetical protein